jgi:fumarate hydratase, class I
MAASEGFPLTGRDAVHAYLMDHEPPFDLNGAVLYHCGSVVRQQGGAWWSKRRGRNHQQPRRTLPSDRYRAIWNPRCDRQRRYGREDLGGFGEMWGGLFERHRRRRAVLRADCGEGAGLHPLDFGIPEAMWHLKVNNFAAIVTMDADGNSLHQEVQAQTGEALAGLGSPVASAASSEMRE